MTQCLIEKRCPTCHKIFPATVDYFGKRKASKDGLRNMCRGCLNIRAKKRYKTKKYREYIRQYQQSKKGKATVKKWNQTEKAQNSQRRRYLKSRYSMTPDAYDKLYNKQKGACAICGKCGLEKHTRLFVDHDHITGKVRGLLCNKCNVKLAGIEDNGFLEKALMYITKCSQDFN